MTNGGRNTEDKGRKKEWKKDTFLSFRWINPLFMSVFLPLQRLMYFFEMNLFLIHEDKCEWVFVITHSYLLVWLHIIYSDYF